MAVVGVKGLNSSVASLFVLLQVMIKVPTVSIDKTDGCMVYLSKDSLNTQLVTAKSSEMNILIPDASGEFVSWQRINIENVCCLWRHEVESLLPLSLLLLLLFCQVMLSIT